MRDAAEVAIDGPRPQRPVFDLDTLPILASPASISRIRARISRSWRSSRLDVLALADERLGDTNPLKGSYDQREALRERLSGRARNTRA